MARALFARRDRQRVGAGSDLTAAFGFQLIAGEPPCPLCVVQRIALMMCALGPLYMLRQARDRVLSSRDIAVGSGIAIVPLCSEQRPPNVRCAPHPARRSGFWNPVLGLHLYTWCLIAFISQIAASGLMLIGSAWIKEEERVAWRVTSVTAGAFIVIVVANLLSVIAEAGFNWDLPPGPVGYLLFKK